LSIVDGDALSASIAAASIVAKVLRDRLMCRLGAAFPAYGFELHKGYGTELHAAALLRHGPTPHHRVSFAPVVESRSAAETS
jgi:ribonuclease HII